MTPNQAALINLLSQRGRYQSVHYLVSCTGGWAVWDRTVKWSQGRTPLNAVNAEDQAFLLKEGYVTMLAGASPFFMDADAYDNCFNPDDPKTERRALARATAPRWKPADEGYRGPSYVEWCEANPRVDPYKMRSVAELLETFT